MSSFFAAVESKLAELDVLNKVVAEQLGNLDEEEILNLLVFFNNESVSCKGLAKARAVFASYGLLCGLQDLVKRRLEEQRPKEKGKEPQ